MLNASTIVEAFAEATIAWHRLPGEGHGGVHGAVHGEVPGAAGSRSSLGSDPASLVSPPAALDSDPAALVSPPAAQDSGPASLDSHPAAVAAGVSTAQDSSQAALPPQPVPLALQPVALALHRANFDLWHEEDNARNPGATDAEIAQVKRNIDRINQQRNDLVEQCDRCLVDWLTASGLLAESAPLHSETPGLMLDRLSILTLKVYHTQEETERRDAPEGHRERNLQRLLTLKSQRADLVECLDCLWSEVLLGRRRFKLYQQLKMYNDPTLNPVLYNAPGATLARP